MPDITVSSIFFTDFMEKFLGERLGERLKVMKERDTFPNCVV